MPTCEQVKKVFAELQSIVGDFGHELDTIPQTRHTDIAREQRKNILEKIEPIREAVETWFDVDKIELRRELSKVKGWSFVGPPNEGGTFVARKGSHQFLVDSEGKVLQELYEWKQTGSSGGVSTWERKRDRKFPGAPKKDVITFIDEKTGEFVGECNQAWHWEGPQEGKGIITEQGDRQSTTAHYVNTKGKKAFRHPMGNFYSAEAFSEDRAVVSSSGFVNAVTSSGQLRKYFIDEKGKKLGDKKYREAKSFSEGFAAVQEEADWYFIDKNGQIAFEGLFYEAHSFKNGMAAVQRGDNWGFINIHGQQVVDFKYKHPSDFVDGRAVVWDSNDESIQIVIDEHGNELGRMETFDRGGGSRNNHIYSDGFLEVALEAGKHVFLGLDGKIAFDKKFDHAHPFVEGMARVQVSDIWYFIDTKGEIVCGPYKELKDFEGGVALVQENLNSGNYRDLYIDKKGNKIFEK